MKAILCLMGKLCLINKLLSLQHILALLLVITIIEVQQSVAQTPNRIKGNVSSASTSIPLVGVTIKVKNTNKTSATDVLGNYQIQANEGDILVFSFVGYDSFEFKVSKQDQINASLNPSTNQLEEVILNAGYYETSKRLATGSIAKISAAEIERQPVGNPLQAMQGRMAGVYIEQTSGIPGTAMNVLIRGRNSIDSGNDPLYLIDGIPFTAESFSSGSALNALSPLNLINPSDIETIEVLKDADATAIYGSRGANGVILITTKKGTAGKTQIQATASTGFSKVSRMMKMMNTAQYLEMRNEALSNDGIAPLASHHDVNGTWDQTRYTDWQKELIGGTANYSNGQLSLRAGDKQTQLLLSGNYHKQTTIFSKDQNTERSSMHFSASHKSPNERFKASVSSIFSSDNSTIFNGDLTNVALSLAPNAPALFKENGSLNWENSTWINPLRNFELSVGGQNRVLNTSAAMEYSIFDDLMFRTNFGFTDIRSNENIQKPSTFDDPALNYTADRATLSTNHTTIRSWIIEPQLHWTKAFGFGKIALLSGLTFQAEERTTTFMRGTGFASDALIGNIKAANQITVNKNDYSEYRYQALFGRLNYNFKNKYLINFTGRRDGSSRFGPNKRYANFASIGAAWIFSEEAFFENNLSFLSTGKLRGSYGTSGNDQIGDYEYLNVYEATGKYNNLSSLGPISLYNPDFGWEVNKKLEGTLDLGFIQDRIFLSATYYQNRSSNQLIKYPLAATTGFQSIRKNLDAKVQNIGFEFELNTVNVESRAFNWTSSLNLTFTRNKLLEFPNIETSSYAKDYIVGHPLDISKRYQFIGLNPEKGVWEVRDFNNDGKIDDDDKQIIVPRGPRYYGGLNNRLQYKKWELNFLFQFVNHTKENFRTMYNLPGINNQPARLLENRWKKPGDHADIQRFTIGYNTDAVYGYINYASSDAAIGDASYIRLKNIELSYEIPFLNNRMKNRIFIQGQNVFTLTNYFGLDPEIANLKLPTLRTLTAGIQITL